MSPDESGTLPPDIHSTDEHEVPIVAGEAQARLSLVLDEHVRSYKRLESFAMALARLADGGAKLVCLVALAYALTACGGAVEAGLATACPTLRFSCVAAGFNVVSDGGAPPPVPACPTGCVATEMTNLAASDECSIACVDGGASK